MDSLTVEETLEYECNLFCEELQMGSDDVRSQR